MEIKKNKEIPRLTAIILAGGKSSRIGSGQDKAILKLNGKLLIDIVIAKLKHIVGDNIIIVGPPEKYPSYKQVVPDLFNQRGLLVGLYSGLKTSASQYNLVVGCDMPFLKVELLQYMRDKIDSNDIIIPRYAKSYVEPLCAIYSKDCLEVMKRNIKAGILSVRKIFPYLKVKYIEEKEIKRVDPELNSFFNVNYKDDFIRAEELIKGYESND
ncbi:MAG: molybdenum cofactor guanylyltransferase [Candidatus Atribacteria bacterium]|nr:molybdenum cofactor guanylyltransferase [Candidatus Atribacteria bacterium]